MNAGGCVEGLEVVRELCRKPTDGLCGLLSEPCCQTDPALLPLRDLGPECLEPTLACDRQVCVTCGGIGQLPCSGACLPCVHACLRIEAVQSEAASFGKALC